MKYSFKASLMVGAAALLFSGCSIFEDTSQKPPLPGERVSVLELQQELVPASKMGKNAGVVTLPAPVSNPAWPQAGGYAHHAIPHAALNVDGLSQAWSADIGSGGDDDFPLTVQPVVESGLVYTLDTSGQVSAFDAKSGAVVWRNSILPEEDDDDILGGGLAANSAMVLATNGYDELLALNPLKGGIYWRVKLSAPTRSAPVFHNDTIFVLTQDNRLSAFEPTAGKKLWDYEGISEGATLVGGATPAVDGQIVVAPLSSGEITALHIENGSVAWSDTLSPRIQTGSAATLPDIAGHPVMADGAVLALSYGGKIVMIDERTGTRIWERDIGGAKTPVVSGNTVFFVSANNELVALSRTDGSLLWIKGLVELSHDDDPVNSLLWNGPVLAGGDLVVTSQSGDVVFVSPLDGSVKKRLTLGDRVVVSPIVAMDTLYLLEDDGTLSAWR